MIVSPLLNDVLRVACLPPAEFLEDYARALRKTGRWLSSRHAAFSCTPWLCVAARAYGEAIAADVCIDKVVKCTQWDERQMMVRIPACIPATIKMSLPGLKLAEIVDVPIFARRAYAVSKVIEGHRIDEVILMCSAALEPIDTDLDD